MDLGGFFFKFESSGHYRVIYTSVKTGRTWSKLITDMTLIDATKNAERPKRKDIEHLKRCVKSGSVIIKGTIEKPLFYSRDI